MPWPVPQTIPIAAIDRSSPWSLHQDLPEDDLAEALQESIQRYGLLRPPLLRATAIGRYEVVCGVRRLMVLNALGITDTLCLVFAPSTRPEALLPIIAHDQRESTPLSAIETARLVKIAETVDKDHGIETIAAILGSNRGRLQRLVRLLDLEPELRTAIHSGQLGVRTGFLLSSLPKDDRLFLCRLFCRLALGENKQQRVLDLATIICVREQRSLRTLFTEQFSYCLDDTAISNPPQTAARLMADLQRLSHPLSSAMQRHFSERINALRLPNRCSVTPSVSFEVDTIILNVTLSSLEDLEQRWPALKPLLQ